MSEYPPLHCRAGRHGRVLAADTGSALQRPELDVCLSAGAVAATGLCGPSTELGHQTVTWQSAERAADTRMQQDTPLTVSKCHPASSSHHHGSVSTLDARSLLTGGSTKYDWPPLAVSCDCSKRRHARV